MLMHEKTCIIPIIIRKLVVLLLFSVACLGCHSVGVALPYVVHIIFSSVWVAEWPPFRKQLRTRINIYSLSILTIYNFSYFLFWLSGEFEF